MKKCLHCQTEIPYQKRRNKFCNSSCFASHSNKISPRIGKRPDSMRAAMSVAIKKWHELKGIPSQHRCAACGNEIDWNWKAPRKTCSPECKKILIQMGGSKGGRKSAESRKLRSSDEIKLYVMCSVLDENILHNEKLVDGWDADIIFPKHRIAILWNGAWHYKQLSLKNHSLKQVQNRDRLKKRSLKRHGWRVLIFEDRYWTPKTAFEAIKNLVVLPRYARDPVSYEETVLLSHP